MPDDARDVAFLDLRGVTEAVRMVVRDEWEALLDSSAFIGGAPVEHFEHAWADYCNSSSAVAVGNGTDSLHLGLRALGIGPGDEVVVPANTFVATVEAVVLAGAAPRFADVDPSTLQLTAKTLEAALTPRTKAVVAVHLYGHMTDMDALSAAASAHGLFLIEDAAQAHGASWAGRPAGSWGAFGSFSFYPGKNLGAFGDGGAITTDDPTIAETVRSLRDHGRAPGSHYEHHLLGTNSRLDALQAVVLSAKLAHLDEWNARRRELWATYEKLIDPAVATLVTPPAGGTAVHHLAVTRVRDRDVVRERLNAGGIGTGIHYPVPVHRMTPYRQYADGPLPGAEAASTTIMSLPMWPHMEPTDVEQVCTRLHVAVEERGVA